jgi:dihydroorotase
MLYCFLKVKSLGETVGCTITVHHLLLTVDDWAGKSHNFCKPVAKFPHDRKALRDVILEGMQGWMFRWTWNACG